MIFETSVLQTDQDHFVRDTSFPFDPGGQVSLSAIVKPSGTKLLGAFLASLGLAFDLNKRKRIRPRQPTIINKSISCLYYSNLTLFSLKDYCLGENFYKIVVFRRYSTGPVLWSKTTICDCRQLSSPVSSPL